MKIPRTIILLISTMLLGLALRVYRMDDLAVFLADQASDSTVVLNMIRGDFTLLGPITSVGGFYNGPIVYYLMVPVYFILQGHPLSGTIFQTLLSIATIPFLYLIGKKMKDAQTGLFASFLFAISPLMIEYSRAAFNAYPAVFFSTIILYLLLKIQESYSWKMTFLMGVCIGFIIQMHYFTIAFLILTLIYPFFKKNLLHPKYYLFLLGGVIAGYSPFLLFEVTHSFLNTKLLLQYLMSSKESSRSIINMILVWPDNTGKLLFGQSIIWGTLGFAVILYSTIQIYLKNTSKKLMALPFLLLIIIVSLIGFLYGGVMQTHYVIAFHTSLIILFAMVMTQDVKRNPLVLSAICLLYLVVNINAMNLHQKKHPLQDGLSIKDFMYTASLIKENTKGSYNVGMHAQGDNRAMPLRYTLKLVDETPEPYENYGDIDSLYFLVKKREPITSLKMWEYTSFGKSQVVKKWDVNDEYFLYKLEKQI